MAKNKTVNNHSPAEESAINILAGVRILQKYKSDVTLIGMNKTILCDGPIPKILSGKDIIQMIELDWIWNDSVWEFYTGD